MDVEFLVTEGRLELKERDQELLAEIQEVPDRQTAAYHWWRLPLHKRIKGLPKGREGLSLQELGLRKTLKLLPRTWLDRIVVMRGDQGR